MKLTWYGHSCFMLETEQGSVVFDPYEPGSVPGLELPELRADLCLCSHGHHDHGYKEAVRLSGRQPELKVWEFPCFHDDKQGMMRGKNLMHLVQAEGRRVLHMGDLGHMPETQLIEQLGQIDLLLIPVGGYYTIDSAMAAGIVRTLEPKIVVPMHYRGEGFGYEVLSAVEEFTERMDRVKVMDTNILEPHWEEEHITIVLKCPVG